jgi:hypothetical protein
MERFTLAALISGGLLLGGIGCSDGKSDYKKTGDLKKAPAVHDEHDHGAKGPHGGSIVELGDEEYHAEVVVDADAHTLRVFVLGKDAKTASPIAAKEVLITPEEKKALTLKAVPLEGEGEEKSSRFELVDEAAVHSFLDAGMIHGNLSVKIGDKPYSGHVDYHLDGIHHEHKDEKPVDAPLKVEEGKAVNPDKPTDGAIVDPK